MIDVTNFPDNALNEELEIRGLTKIMKSPEFIKQRVVKYKAKQIMKGDLDGFPDIVLEDDGVYEKARISHLHDRISEAIRKIDKKPSNTLFTAMVLLFGRSFRANTLFQDHATEMIHQDIIETLKTIWNVEISVQLDEAESPRTGLMDLTVEVDNNYNQERDIPEEAESPLAEVITVEIKNNHLENSDSQSEVAESPPPGNLAEEKPCFRCKEPGHGYKDCTNRRVRREKKNRNRKKKRQQEERD